MYNTEVVFDPGGTLIAAYRKVFPWRPYEAWASGHEFVVADLPGGIGRAGLSICYDSWFPEATRSVAWMGAEFVVNVVKTIGADRKQERVLAQANAIVNQVFMLSVNAAGPIGTGGSLVCDPEAPSSPTCDRRTRCAVRRVGSRRRHPRAGTRHRGLQPDVVADGRRRSGDRVADLSGPDRSDPVGTERSVMTETPRLQKQLRLRSLVLFGLAYMTPIIVLGIFGGVIAELSDGGSAGSYLVATVAMLFTALSYAVMAKHFPVAGSAYTYVRKSLDSRVGFVVGWAILLDYLFLPLVIWLIGGSYLHGQFPPVCRSSSGSWRSS